MANRPTNILKFPTGSFPEIFGASVHSDGVRIGGSRNEVWLCPAYSGSRDLWLYVKPRLTERQVVAELVAAQVGMCLGLPCPQPYLVSVASRHVGGRRGVVQTCFGCEQVGPRSMATPVRSLSMMLEMLHKAKAAEGTAALDEWIANPVRSTSDILFDPEGAVWLIDHEAALAPGIAVDEAVTNWLAQRLMEGLGLAERARLLETIRGRSLAAHKSKLGRPALELENVSRGPELYREAVGFLQQRLEHLDCLLSHRILPEQGHLGQNPPDTSAPDETSGTPNL